MMGFFHATATFAAALVLGACANTTPERSEPVVSAAPQPIEPEAVQPIPASVRGDLIVLLPKPNGTIGGVVVRSNGSEELLLNQPYAGARVDAAGNVYAVTYDVVTTKQEFDAAVSALPGRPASFTLYFLEGRDQFTGESEREVTRIFAELAARPDPEIWVIGHTDAVGTVQYNDQLSLQRAERVRDDLVSRGIPQDRIAVSGRGKREPIVPTSEDIPEARNRRVEINVR